MTTSPLLDDLVMRHRAPGFRRVAWAIMILLALFVAWASVAQLDEVATANGEVTPQGRVKVIQHLEGGLVTDIAVREGDTVHVGESLMTLDLGSLGTNREEIQVRIDGLELARARLTAEANGAALAFPEAEAARRPSLVQAERGAYQARASELEATLRVLTDQERQRTAELRELQAKRQANELNIRLLRQKLAMSASLLRDGLTAKMDHVQLQSDVEMIQGEISVLDQSIPRVEASLAEARSRIDEARLSFRREAREQLSQVEMDLARNRELLAKATDQQTRTEIKSPIEGIVKNLRISTIGGVVRGGEPIMDIVPSKDDLVVEVHLAPTDRGYVREGQKATIKISTYDFVRYGGLDGTVVMVAPDSTVPEQGLPYFRVLVQPHKYHLGDKPGEYQISPGMQATVDIHTGTRSVLDFLVKPVLKMKHEAFRER